MGVIFLLTGQIKLSIVFRMLRKHSGGFILTVPLLTQKFPLPPMGVDRLLISHRMFGVPVFVLKYII